MTLLIEIPPKGTRRNERGGLGHVFFQVKFFIDLCLSNFPYFFGVRISLQIWQILLMLIEHDQPQFLGGSLSPFPFSPVLRGYSPRPAMTQGKKIIALQ